MKRHWTMTPVIVALGIAMEALGAGAAQNPRAADVTRSPHDVEVTATGCLLGDTLVETNFSKDPSENVSNPPRRWRLRLTSSQRQLLKELDPKRQVEIWGVADAREVVSALASKSVRVGRGRAYVGTRMTGTPAGQPVVTSMLVVESVKQIQDVCE